MSDVAVSTSNDFSFSATMEKIQKGMKYNAGWDKDTFRDFPDCVYWIRQFIALFLGIICGILPIYGINGFIVFGLTNVVVPFWYYAKYSNVNIDDFGSMSLIGEGFQQSSGLFLLSWIITYSAFHFP
jgi:hypothetical protein